MTTAPATGSAIDRILDSGRDGLAFFATFIPRYRSWTGSDPLGEDTESLTARYDQQQGMDLTPLREFGRVLDEQLTGHLHDQASLQRARFVELPARWNGSAAAEAAAAYTKQLDDRVDAHDDALTQVAHTISRSADELEDAVRRKATLVRTEFTDTTVGRHCATEVDQIIAYARGDFGTVTDDTDRVAMVQQVAPECPSNADPQDFCSNWLNQVLVPAVENHVASFTEVTDAAHTSISRSYSALCNALEDVHTTGYTSPGGAPAAATDLDHRANADPTHIQTAALFGSSPQATGLATQVSEQHADQPPPEGDKPTPADGGTNTDPTGAPPAKADPPGPAATSPKAAPDKPKDADAPKPPADMGTAGQWRPGDIATVVTAASQITGKVPDLLAHLGDPLEAIGKTAKDFGDAAHGFGELAKDVLGPDGIAGVIKESAIAAEKFDGINEHHTHPHDPADPDTNHPAGQDKPDKNSSPGSPATPGHNSSAQPSPSAPDTATATADASNPVPRTTPSNTSLPTTAATSDEPTRDTTLPIVAVPPNPASDKRTRPSQTAAYIPFTLKAVDPNPGDASHTP